MRTANNRGVRIWRAVSGRAASSGIVSETEEGAVINPETGRPEFLGTVKSFERDKGFGFVSCPAATNLFGRDVFLHRAQFRDVEVGDQVRFQIELNENTQPQARWVVRVVKAQSEASLDDLGPGAWGCPSCGASNRASSWACTNCGTIQPETEEEKAAEAAAAAAALESAGAQEEEEEEMDLDDEEQSSKFRRADPGDIVEAVQEESDRLKRQQGPLQDQLQDLAEGLDGLGMEQGEEKEVEQDLVDLMETAGDGHQQAQTADFRSVTDQMNRVTDLISDKFGSLLGSEGPSSSFIEPRDELESMLFQSRREKDAVEIFLAAPRVEAYHVWSALRGIFPDTLNSRDTVEWEEFTARALEVLYESPMLDARDTMRLMVAFLNLAVDVQVLKELAPYLMRAIDRVKDDITPKEAAQCFDMLPKIVPSIPGMRQLADLLFDRMDLDVIKKPGQMANLLYVAGELGIDKKKVQWLLDDLLERVTAERPLRTQAFAKLLRAMVMLGEVKPAFFRFAGDMVIENLADEVRGKPFLKRKVREESLPLMICAYAQARVRHDDFFLFVTGVVSKGRNKKRIKQLSGWAASALLWAWPQAGYPKDSHMTKFRMMIDNDCRDRQIPDEFIGIAWMGPHHFEEKMLSKFSEPVERLTKINRKLNRKLRKQQERELRRQGLGDDGDDVEAPMRSSQDEEEGVDSRWMRRELREAPVREPPAGVRQSRRSREPAGDQRFVRDSPFKEF